MEFPERRRNVSAPTLTTPPPLQTQGPPQAYQRLSTDSLAEGNGLSACSSDTNPYWPFDSAESAFEYLDAEFSAPLTGIEPTFPTNINEDESVRLSKIIPTTVLKEYIEQKTQKYITASSEAETREKINPIEVRQLLRQLNNPRCAKDLDTFTADYSFVSMPLGYILDEVDKTPQWLHLIIGVGNFGVHMYTTVRCAQREIRGVALGMLHDSPHIVIVVPGGGVYLCQDPEDETPENPLLEFEFARIFVGVQDVGLEFELAEVEEYGPVEFDFT